MNVVGIEVAVVVMVLTAVFIVLKTVVVTVLTVVLMVLKTVVIKVKNDHLLLVSQDCFTCSELKEESTASSVSISEKNFELIFIRRNYLKNKIIMMIKIEIKF